ncbi:MAG: TolC family protein [Candidatus Omnitrophota bacterium]
MKAIKTLGLMIALLSLASSVYAGLELGLKDTIDAALKTSEAVKISENNIKKSQAVYKQSRSGLLPHLNANATWTNNTEYPVSAEKTTDYDLKSGISITQLLWSFGRVSAAVDAARKSVEAIRLQDRAKKRDIIYTAKLSYYSLLFTQNVFLIAQESYNSIVANKKLLELRAQSGRNSKRDIIKMDADIAARIPQLSEARAQCQTALKTLNTLVDLPLDTKINLIDQFPVNNQTISYEEQLNKLYANEPALKALDAQIKAAEAMLSSKRADTLATVSLFAEGDYNGGSNDKKYIGSEEIDTYASAGISVNVPLWNGGEKWAMIEQAKADRDNARLERKLEEKNLLLSLKTGIEEYVEYLKTLDANNQAVRLAEESYTITRDMFETGQVSLTDLNDAEQLLTSQKLQQQQTLYNIAVTKAKIERLTVKD